MKKILFVCIHNSARSQMAEELLRQMASNEFEVESAGINPGILNPLVVDVLKEKKIDILNKKTQSVQSLLDAKKEYDCVITVCDETSSERCPVFPGTSYRLHWSFEDPSSFEGSHEEKFKKTRMIRDQIASKMVEWLREQKGLV